MHRTITSASCSSAASTAGRACAAARGVDRARAASRPARGRAHLLSRRARIFSHGARVSKNATTISTRPRAASDDGEASGGAEVSLMSKAEGLLEKVGLSLGPIGMTLGESKAKLEASVDDDFDDDDVENDENDVVAKGGEMLDNAGLSLGPIGMTLGGAKAKAKAKAKAAGVGPDASAGTGASAKPKSIAPLTTAEWRAKNVNPDGTVDLFVEDHYNVASRVAGGVEGLSQGGGSSDNNLVNVENIAWSGLPSDAVDGARHRVAVTDHVTGEVLELDVPENRYVLFEAEQEGWELPNACRMGCCTKCAVRVTKGKLEQREALGLSRRYRDEGYALLCVSTVVAGPVECVTQDEEEIYQKQFGEVFNELAADKRSKAVVRDDFALEIADMDE